MKFDSRGYVRIGHVRIYRAPVFVHWSALLACVAILLSGFREPIYAAAFIASYFGLILLHEFGHAFVASRFGCRVHAIKMAILHGVCEYDMPYSEREDAVIAWGGVLAQLIVAIPLISLSLVFDMKDLEYLRPPIVFLGYLSVAIAIVNLAPSNYLDGNKAWKLVPMLVRDFLRNIRSKKKAHIKVVK